MKIPQHFGLVYCLLAIAQIIIGNCFYLSSYVSLSILPVMILCIPLNISTPAAMVIAFATGLATDVLSEGLIGLNALAAVPVAFVRTQIIRIIFGEELIERQESFSFRKFGAIKISLAIIIAQAVFLAVYILADGAGTRPLWFNAARFAASLSAGYVLSMIVAGVITPDEKK